MGGRDQTGDCQSVLFIPIVTPSAVSSAHCQFEFNSFLKREASLGRSNLVFPLLYVRVPALEHEEQWRRDEALKIIGSRQYIDWQDFRHRDLREPEVARKIELYCRNIVETLQTPLVTPDERRAEDERRWRQVEAKTRDKAERERQAREAEERRRAEEDERQRATEKEERREKLEAQAQRHADGERRKREAEAKERRTAEAVAERRKRAEAEVEQKEPTEQQIVPNLRKEKTRKAEATQIVSGLPMLQALVRATSVISLFFASRYLVAWINSLFLFALSAGTLVIAFGIDHRRQWARVAGLTVCGVGVLHDAILASLYFAPLPETLKNVAQALGALSILYLPVYVVSIVYLYRAYRPSPPTT